MSTCYDQVQPVVLPLLGRQPRTGVATLLDLDCKRLLIREDKTMAEGYDDEYRFRRHRQFVLELEREIGQLNRRIVHERMPHLTRERCLDLVAAVARSRAEYLNLAFRASAAKSETSVTEDDITTLAEARRRFEELRDAFTAWNERSNADMSPLSYQSKGACSA